MPFYNNIKEISITRLFQTEIFITIKLGFKCQFYFHVLNLHVVMYIVMLGLPSSKYWTNGPTKLSFNYSIAPPCTTDSDGCASWSLKSYGKFLFLIDIV